MGIGKWKAGDGIAHPAAEAVPAAGRRQLDPRGPQQLEIPVKAADVELEPAGEPGAGLRAGGQYPQKPIQARGPLAAHGPQGRPGGCGTFAGHPVLGTLEIPSPAATGTGAVADKMRRRAGRGPDEQTAAPVASALPAAARWMILGRPPGEIKVAGPRAATDMAELDYLVIAPHPDDAELGAGGTIALLKQQGARVGVLDLTTGEPTPFGSPERRRSETDEASRILGLDWRGNLGLPNRALAPSVEARARLAGALRRLRPTRLLAPYWEDSHPDHVAASALVDAARFWAKLTKTDLGGQPHFPERIFYYLSVHLRIHPRPSFVVDISAHVETKLRAVAAYRSQFLDGRSTTAPTVLDDLRDRARYWGWAVGVAYGEPLVAREEIGLRSLRDLV